MNPSRMVLAAAVTAGVLASSLAPAQDYPSRPITVVYPFAPGGSGSNVLRSVSDRLEKALGQPIVIESRPGAGTTVGARSIAKSNADGYTLLSATNATLVIAPALYSNAGYDPRKDLAPVGTLGQAPSVLVVHPSFPVHSIAELIAFAKRADKAVTFGSPGIGTPTHLSGELVAAMAKIRLTHVPYRGASQAVTDLMGGHIQMLFSAIPNVHGHIKAGRLRALAVSSSKRSPLLPEIPTVAESGLPGFDTAVKYYLVAPAATPRAITDKLNAALRAALVDPDVLRRFTAEGAEPASGTLEEFATDMDREEAKWLPLVKALGLKQ